MLGVKNENKLREIEEKLNHHGIRLASFIEPDIGNQLTAIASEIINDSETRKLFKKYDLLKIRSGEVIQ